MRSQGMGGERAEWVGQVSTASSLDREAGSVHRATGERGTRGCSVDVGDWVAIGQGRKQGAFNLYSSLSLSLSLCPSLGKKK